MRKQGLLQGLLGIARIGENHKKTIAIKFAKPFHPECPSPDEHLLCVAFVARFDCGQP